MEKSKSKVIVAIIAFLILALGVGGYFLLADYDSNNNDNTNNSENASDNNNIVSKEFLFVVDEIGYLNIVADITLDEELQSNEVINIDAKSYDTEGNLLHTYLLSSRTFDISGTKEIHLAFNDYESMDVNEVAKIEGTVKVEEREHDATANYEFKTFENPEVVESVFMYRAFLDLDDYYKNNSGLCILNYDDNTEIIEIVSYLDDPVFIGVARDEDFSTKNGANLDSITVYKYSYLWLKD